MSDDEEVRELTDYIWGCFTDLITDSEHRIARAGHARRKAVASPSSPVYQVVVRRWGATDDLEINAALADGFEAFRRRVSDRVIAEHGAEIVVNRCPACHRVVRTPHARQCFWCGRDWHD